MMVYTTRVRENTYVTRIKYEMSNGESGSLGVINGNEKSVGSWIFSPNCATSYAVKFIDTYLFGLEIKSDDSVNPPKKNPTNRQEAMPVG
jgi:hypothetical protein